MSFNKPTSKFKTEKIKKEQSSRRSISRKGDCLMIDFDKWKLWGSDCFIGTGERVNLVPVLILAC